MALASNLTATSHVVLWLVKASRCCSLSDLDMILSDGRAHWERVYLGSVVAWLSNASMFQHERCWNWFPYSKDLKRTKGEGWS